MANKVENIKFDISQSNLKKLLDKIKDLAKIQKDKIVIFKFEKDSLILFSFVGNSFKTIYAFKNYIFKYDDIFDHITEVKEPMTFIVKNGIKLYHNLNLFSDYKTPVSCDASPSNTQGFLESMKFWNEENGDVKYEIRITGGDDMLIGKEITMDDINQLMNTTNCLFKYTLNSIDYDRIKKKSTIDVKENDIINILVEDNKLYMGENTWKLKICDINQPNETYTFPKRYFNTINTTSEIDIYVFETYILTKYEDYNLMIVLEMTV
jgi:hypothetical protein